MEMFHMISIRNTEICDRALRNIGLIAPSVSYLMILLATSPEMGRRLSEQGRMSDLGIPDQEYLLDVLGLHYTGKPWPNHETPEVDINCFFEQFHDRAGIDGWAFDLG